MCPGVEAEEVEKRGSEADQIWGEEKIFVTYY